MCAASETVLPCSASLPVGASCATFDTNSPWLRPPGHGVADGLGDVVGSVPLSSLLSLPWSSAGSLAFGSGVSLASGDSDGSGDSDSLACTDELCDGPAVAVSATAVPVPPATARA